MPDTQNIIANSLPFLLGSAAGAGYGAYRAPGGSRGRGAVIGGSGGTGAALGLLAVNKLLESPQAKFIAGSPGVAAATALGGAGLGLTAGLHGGRELADLVGLKGRKNNNPDNDLEEIDPSEAAKSHSIGGNLSSLLFSR